MADTRIFSNGNGNAIWVPLAGIADPASPTAAELAAGIPLSPAIAWDGTTWPSNTESNDVDDRSILDKGNATSRGYAQFEASLNFFYPKELSDTTGEYGRVYQAFRIPRVPGYLVTRVIQNPEGEHTPFVAGNWISVFKFTADTFAADTEGEDSYKYTVDMLPQGAVYAYTQVKNATPVTVVNASGTGALDVGEHAVLRATLGGKRATQVVEWVSSNLAVATVSGNGVVTAVGVGTANITANHPAASAASTAVEITVS